MHRDKFNTLIKNFDNAIEIGVAKGSYSKIIYNWGFKKLYLCDAWREYKDQDGRLTPQSTCNKWIEDLITYFKSKPVIFVIEDSVKAASHFDNNFFDFIYIDADHSYEGVKADLNAWYDKCKIGGLFAGHDILTKNTGVKKALDEFCNNKKIKYNVTNGTHRIPASWWIRK
jgi:hypothetical protein